ncbi:unnamed protein product [Miscanthus lutarioriparius]|uniref:LOB domain-containing protein n=1 Tax=Miscanthus lutarioriparius TaxID=422564 RepID=A0A811R672_9POAL|nr:unnamed protein product [Miscanthus lutarioriparius]
MTSSVAPTTAASQLHITTIATATGTSALTPPSSNHSPSNARSSPHSASSSPRGSSTTTGGTGGGGGGSGGSGSTNQACAACKYQRRKCNPDCPLAPYFPADQQRRFLNAHRLFGVSNILKTLKKLRPDLCADAMGTLIYQSDMRAKDPVGGCYRLILSLERQVEIETAELSAVLHHLALCRQAATAMPPQQQGGGMADLDVTSSNQPLLLNAQQEVVDALYTTTHDADTAILPTDEVVHHHGGGHSPKDDHGEQQQQQQLFDYFYYDATASDDASSKPTIDINLDNMQQFDFDDSCAAADKVDLMAPAGPDEEIRHQQQHLDVNCGQIDAKDYFEIKAVSLVDAFDMRQELQPVVDVNDAGVDIDIKTVDVNAAGIGVDIKAMDMNANVDVNVDLQEEDGAINVSTAEAAQMAAESSHCRLGLGFSSF